MQRLEVLDLLLQLGLICLFANTGIESREGLDTRDIAVSDKIVAAKEVKGLLPCHLIWIVFINTCEGEGAG